MSMGFFRQEYWSGLPFSPPGDLLNPGSKSASPALQADFLPLSHRVTWNGVKTHVKFKNRQWCLLYKSGNEQACSAPQKGQNNPSKGCGEIWARQKPNCLKFV